MKKHIKAILLSISWICYLDLIYSPNKGFHFFTFFSKFQLYIVIALLLSLLIQIINEFSKSMRINVLKKSAQLVFLFTSLLVFNEIFFNFQFNSLNIILELFIVMLFSIPIIFIMKDFLEIIKVRILYALIFGLSISVLTLLYFKYFYISYEDYFDGLPIVFVHHWIRNWIIFIGGILTLASLLNIYKTAVNREFAK